MPGWVEPGELLVLALVVLLVFGPKRLPEIGRSLGRGIRDFKNAIASDDDGFVGGERSPVRPADRDSAA
jgi:sec-independent protein translocase protein TatA